MTNTLYFSITSSLPTPVAEFPSLDICHAGTLNYVKPYIKNVKHFNLYLVFSYFQDYLKYFFEIIYVCFCLNVTVLITL